MFTRASRGVYPLLVVLALLTAACSSTDSDDSGAEASTSTADAAPASSVGTTDETSTDSEPTESSEPPTETTTAVELFDSFEGVTAETISIGGVVTDLDELRETGITDQNFGDPDLIYQTLVDDINANGGVLGRDLEVVVTRYNPVLEASAEEACVKLTQDETVFAVLGGVTGPARDVISCFTDTNETIVVGGIHTPEHLQQARAPWIASDMSTDRRFEAIIGLFDQEGLLEGNLATFDDSSEHETITQAVVIPALEDLGYTVTTQLTTTVTPGDEVEVVQQSKVFAERAIEDGIDTMLIVQSQLPLGLPAIREAGYEGTVLVVDSSSQLSTIGGLDENPPSVYDGAIGGTGLSDEEAWELESTQDCVTRFTDANPDIEVLPSTQVPDGDPDWLRGLVPICRYLDTFTMVAEAAGADLNQDTFLEAANETGSFPLAARPFNSLTEGKLDAEDGLRLGIFDSTIGESGTLVPYTEFEDIG